MHPFIPTLDCARSCVHVSVRTLALGEVRARVKGEWVFFKVKKKKTTTEKCREMEKETGKVKDGRALHACTYYPADTEHTDS